MLVIPFALLRTKQALRLVQLATNILNAPAIFKHAVITGQSALGFTLNSACPIECALGETTVRKFAIVTLFHACFHRLIRTCFHFMFKTVQTFSKILQNTYAANQGNLLKHKWTIPIKFMYCNSNVL